MKINKRLSILLSLLIITAGFLVYFILSFRYNASTVLNKTSQPSQPNQTSQTQNNYSNQILAIEQKNYPGVKLMVGRFTQVGNYLRADIGEPYSDGAVTGLYKLESGGKVVKIQEIDLETIDETGNINYGKPKSISDTDWQKLIDY